MNNIINSKEVDIDSIITGAEEVLNSISKYGVKIDLSILYSIRKKLGNEIEGYVKELNNYTHPKYLPSINPRSSCDCKILFEEVSKKYVDERAYQAILSIMNDRRYKTAKGNYSFKQEVLEAIYEETSWMPAFYVKEIKSKESLINKLNELENYCDDNKFVHPFWDYGETFRISYNHPGLSNIAEELREVVTADDGYTLVKIDYDQQEPTILVSWLKIEKLKKIMEEYHDFYRALGKFFWNKDIDDDVRSKLKTAWLATTYGAEIPTIAKQVGSEWAKTIYNEINSKLPEFSRFKRGIEDKLSRRDYEVTSYFGRTRELRYMGNYTKRAMLNSPIQMTGADILMLALYSIKKYKELYDIPDDILRVYWTIHDEIILHVKEGYEELGREIANLISFKIDDWLPLHVNNSISKTYKNDK